MRTAGWRLFCGKEIHPGGQRSSVRSALRFSLLRYGFLPARESKRFTAWHLADLHDPPKPRRLWLTILDRKVSALSRKMGWIGVRSDCRAGIRQLPAPIWVESSR